MYKRRYYKRTPNRDKYSVEQTFINPPASTEWELLAATDTLEATRQTAYSIIPPTDVQGMRKVKHFTLTFSANTDVSILYYALVFVPQGYSPQRVNIPLIGYASPAYSANQFVISQGLLDTNAGPLRIRSPLSRNLNSGDSIYLLFAVPDGSNVTPKAAVRFAITLQ